MYMIKELKDEIAVLEIRRGEGSGRLNFYENLNIETKIIDLKIKLLTLQRKDLISYKEIK